ncbi:MAG: hypothetical protein OEQ53_23185 [Saprospiraceae bacterium]|nr:hypothetical protein [Saprospiraceae bacterium]
MIQLAYRELTRLRIFSDTMGKAKIVLILIVFTKALLCTALSSYAQSDLQTETDFHLHLKKMLQMEDERFPTGVVPSYIFRNRKHSKGKPDQNIYFTALSVFTLRTLLPLLDSQLQDLIQDFIDRTNKSYVHYQNATGRPTYNFWRTDTAFIYPFARWLKPFLKHPDLADDMDDTVMALFAMGAPDSVAQQVHAIMQNYVNGVEKRVRGTPAAYRNIHAYSTWFGKKFPVIFDVCVSTNQLLFIDHYNLEWTSADSATLQFVMQVLANDDHRKRPRRVSPYYERTPIILYHLARLSTTSGIPDLSEIKEKVVMDIYAELTQSKNLMEKVILCTSLFRLGDYSHKLSTVERLNLIGQLDKPLLPFFVSNFSTYFPNILRDPFSLTGWMKFDHYCPLYQHILWLEYLTLEQ